MSMPSLFGPDDPGLRARASDPDTSRAAALAVDVNRRALEVLHVAASNDFGRATFTDGQLAQACHEDRNIIASRRGDLVRADLVQPVLVECEDPKCGCHAAHIQLKVVGGRGRWELVWELTQEGRTRGREPV